MSSDRNTHGGAGMRGLEHHAVTYPANSQHLRSILGGLTALEPRCAFDLTRLVNVGCLPGIFRAPRLVPQLNACVGDYASVGGRRGRDRPQALRLLTVSGRGGAHRWRDRRPPEYRFRLRRLPAHGRQLYPGTRGYAAGSVGSLPSLAPEATCHPGTEILSHGYGAGEPARARQSPGARLQAVLEEVREAGLPRAFRLDPVPRMRRPALVLAACRRIRGGFRDRRDETRARSRGDAEDRLPPPEGTSERGSRSPLDQAPGRRLHGA